MNIFSVLTLLGGLALFLYGMHLMGDALKKLAGGKLESILARLTDTRFKGFLLGLFVTATIQSSSAVIVMLVGFVNSGIMQLSQTTAIIMGANIGTTVTAWLLSLSGISGSTVFLRFLKPETFTPILSVIAIIFILFSKNEKRKNIATVLMGFSILMFGMKAMSSIDDTTAFSNAFMAFKNPFAGILIGTLITAVIQSSSASVGILQALSLTTPIPFSIAIPIILGQNLGAAITPLLSSIGGNKHAKRVAVSGLYIKIIGVVVVGVLFYICDAIFSFSFMSENANVFTIAVVHTAFNVFSTVILLPFCSQIEKLACMTVGGNHVENDVFSVLDDRFLSIPGFAVTKCKELVFDMAEKTRQCVLKSVDMISGFDKNVLKEISDSEKEIDKYEDKTGAYLIKISSQQLDNEDNSLVSRLLHAVGDLERISDHAVNLSRSAEEMNTKNIVFSTSAQNDIGVIKNAVREIVNLTVDSFVNEDIEKARLVEPLSRLIDNLRYKIKDNHIQRLRDGKCTAELGFVLSDMLSDFERISGHCSNVAVTLLDAESNAETHKYLRKLRKEEDEYSKNYEIFEEKYRLE